jgi:hypothetical protein
MEIGIELNTRDTCEVFKEVRRISTKIGVRSEECTFSADLEFFAILSSVPEYM